MTEKEFYEDINFIKQKVLVKFPALGVYMAKIKYYPANCATVCTDGKDIYIAPDFWSKFSDNDKTFLIAHEIFHIASNHVPRGVNRDVKVWNVATDSVINQILVSQSLMMIAGGVDIVESLDKSADEMYDKLMKEKKENLEKFNTKYKFIESSSHDIWGKIIEQLELERKKQNERKFIFQKIKNFKNKHNIQETQMEGFQSSVEFEKKFLEKNNDLKKQIERKVKNDLIEKVDRIKSSYENSIIRNIGRVGHVSKPISWKILLKKEIERETIIWSDRYADEDNDWASRMTEIEECDEGETEVFIDVSGSVNNDMIREFLRQLKPLLRESKLKVGCFDTYIYPFQEIKTEKDIDNFKVKSRAPQHEDFDAAVKSFSKSTDVNKIIFTDGQRTSTVPSQETRNINVLWLVYGNVMNFTPVCGKVIKIQGKDFQEMMRSKKEPLKGNMVF